MYLLMILCLLKLTASARLLVVVAWFWSPHTILPVHAQVFEMLKAACLKALSQLGTSLKQDALLLRDASAEPCLHAALSWRLTYKRWGVYFFVPPLLVGLTAACRQFVTMQCTFLLTA